MKYELSRRELLTGSLLASTGWAQSPDAAHPEVAVITALGPDHPLIRSLISQLLENGLFFDIRPEEGLLRETPDDLGVYKAVIFDGPARAAALSRAETRRRLDEYASAGGFVYEIDEPIEGRTGPGVNPNWLIDLVTSHRSYSMITHARLTRFHPEMKRRLLARPVETVIGGLYDELLGALAGMNSWGEYTLHYWKAARALDERGRHPELKDKLITSIEQAAGRMLEPSVADRAAGYFATVWLVEETGNRGPLEKARAGLDRIMADRPRTMGVLTHDGFVNDPLGLRESGEGLGRTTSRRDVVWTESLHYYGPAFASMSRVTGEGKYLEEAVRLADHVARYHVRADNLLAHCTRDGRPVAGAWGRGQTHALYGLLYMLEEMDSSHPAFERITDCLRRIGGGLRRHQDPDTGLWRNVIDDESARLESSCSTGITYVYGRCVREGWLKRADFEPMLRRAWDGLRRLYWRRGMAANCRGTGTGMDDVYYLARPQGWARMPHMILASVEMERMFE